MEASATDPVSLQEVFALLPEVRQARGRRHPLLAILNLTAVALLSGMKSLEAIAQFARDHGPPLAEALGFTHWPTPCKATLSNVLRRLDVAAYENALSAWLKRRCPTGATPSPSTAKPCVAVLPIMFRASTCWPPTPPRLPP